MFLIPFILKQGSYRYVKLWAERNQKKSTKIILLLLDFFTATRLFYAKVDSISCRRHLQPLNAINKGWPEWTNGAISLC